MVDEGKPIELDLIGVPTNSAGKRGCVAGAPDALRRAGLTEVLGRSCSVHDLGNVAFSAPTTERDKESGIIAPGTLISMTLGVKEAVRGALQGDRFPLVIGGDCPVLLGCLLACKESDARTGLLFVDGHETHTRRNSLRPERLQTWSWALCLDWMFRTCCGRQSAPGL